jgi:hypothetical protein
VQDRVSLASTGQDMRAQRANPRAASAGPAVGGGPALAASVEVRLAIADSSEDLTMEALIGAFIGSASARGAHAGVIADAEGLSITRLEGSRWRKKAGAGLLWS